MKLIKTLLQFFTKLLGLNKTHSRVGKQSEIKPKDTEPEKKVNRPTAKKVESSKEPEHSNKKCDLRSFLWKPVSENNGNPVVLVASDDIKAKDLHMEIVGKSGKVLKVAIQNTGRANGLGGFKLGRIHFRINRTAKQLLRSTPLKIRFFLSTKKGKHYITVRGKKALLMKNPTRRKDLK